MAQGYKTTWNGKERFILDHTYNLKNESPF